MTEKQTASLPDMQSTNEVVQSTMQQFLEGANVGRVYGRPVRHGEVTMIPAAEVIVAMGLGIGAGAGLGESEDSGAGSGFGGGGGGGKTFSRPVAVVVSSPDGVRVERVLDPTKMALAVITAVGFMGGMLLRMMTVRSKLRQQP